MVTISPSRLLVLGLSLGLAACGGDGLTLPPDGAAAHIDVVSGNGQGARVGAMLPESLVVQVTDTRDRPVADAQVVFEFTADGSEATPATVSTDADGIAWSRLKLGTRVGPVSGTVSVPVGAGFAPVEVAITATALPGDANGIAEVSGNGQSAPVNSPLPAPLVVQVTDQNDNPISGVTISWTFTGGGSVSNSTTVTGADGLASVSRTLGPTAGEQTTDATVGGLAGSPVTFTHTATAGTAAGVNKFSGDGQSALAGTQLTDPLVVQVLDAQSNPIADRDVTWVVGNGGGSVSPENTRTDAQGFANTRWTLGPSAGANSLNAVVSGVGTATFNATATAGAPSASNSSVSASRPEITVGSQTSTITVIVRDAGDNPVSGVSVTLASTGTGNTINPASASSGANGVATFTFSSTVGEEKTITATAGGVEITDQATVTVKKVTSNVQITSMQPEPSLSGQDVTVAFTVSGNGGTPTGTVVITLDQGSETCTGTLSNGSGSCTLAPTVAGTRRVTATYSGDARFLDDTDGENHLVRPAVRNLSTTQITGVSPEPSTSGQQFTVTFTVTGEGGGTPTGIVTISSQEETGGCEASVAQGSCSFTLSLVGTHHLQAFYPGDAEFEDSSDPDGQDHVVLPAPSANQPPTATDDSYSTPTDVTLNAPAGSLTANDSPPELGDTYSTSLSSPTPTTAGGQVSVLSDGSFSYTPAAAFTGPDTFEYTVSDGRGGSDAATVTVTVGP